MLRYDGSQWKRDVAASAASEGAGLNALWLSPDGSRGWAAGEKGTMLRYDGSQWKRDVAAFAASRGADLKALWLNADGSRGWTAGEKGIMLRYDGIQWKRDDAASAASGGAGFNALWLSPDGSHGWAAGEKGIMLRYDGIQWKRDDAASAASGGVPLKALWLNTDGTHGWAVGGYLIDGVVLRYDGSQWKRDDTASAASGGTDLRALWLSPDGTHGWAAGERGITLRYGGTQWKRDDAASAVSGGADLNALWLNTDGSRGWAAGEKGIMLRYDGSQWKRDDAGSAASGGAGLNALWLSPDGSWGWAAGEKGIMLRYDGSQWKRDVAASAASEGAGLNALWLSPDGSRGWAAGEKGTMLRYDGSQWKRDVAAFAASRGADLKALWLNADGSRGWTAGNYFTGLSLTDSSVLRYDGTQWKLDSDTSLVFKGLPLSAFWLNMEGTRGWAAGTLLFTNDWLRYDGTQWKFDDAAVNLPLPNAFWLSTDGSRGWAVGWGVLRYDGAQWNRDDSASAASKSADLKALWMNADGTRGWAVGKSGVVLSAEIEQRIGASIDPNVDQFSGTVKLLFHGLPPHPNSVKLAILDTDDATLIPDDHFTIKRVRGDDRTFDVSFGGKASEIATQKAGKPFHLQVTADFGDQKAPTRIALQPEGSLYVKGTYWLWPYIYAFSALLFVNIGLVVTAVFSTWVRRLVLDPMFRTLMGIGILRYFVTEPLLIYVPPIRDALFRDYRLKLAGHPQIRQWESNRYILPCVTGVQPNTHSLPLKRSKLTEQTGGETEDEKSAKQSLSIETILDSLLCKGNSRQQIWLVEGPSGLGKSAFLQQIARVSLNRGMTPLFIPLGSEHTPDEEVAALMSEYGDMNVSIDTATNIVDGGGFVVLLDALNEDRQPTSTLKFVRKARKRNLVILSSQFPPNWPQNVPIERLDLSPFLREQLKDIIPEGWLDLVLGASHLSAVIGLPITAMLLGRFILRYNKLPSSDFAIYSSLDDDLNTNQALNLEQQAWNLFRTNDQQFKADAHLTEVFCEAAVKSNVLTRRSAGEEVFYCFVHERIHRFFVARYIVRQDETSLSTWHEQLAPGFGKDYWADVIEFLAATYAHLDDEIGRRTQAYTNFLREAATFAPRVFSERLYSQYQRYRDAGDVLAASDFQDWSAWFLAEIVAGKKRGMTVPRID